MSTVIRTTEPTETLSFKVAAKLISNFQVISNFLIQTKKNKIVLN